MSTLPITPLLAILREAFEQQRKLVLQAPPGAGKTTAVPLALRDAPYVQGQKILMLEPRRLAARAAARYMAQSLGETLGQTVGYRVRNDTQVGPNTVIEVVTEGVLTRMLQHDPALEGYALVIFDEFHERSLHADLGLALCLDAQAVLREDLRLLVMSATLDGEAVAHLLGDVPLLKSEGRGYPVQIIHRPIAQDFARNRRGFCAALAQLVCEVIAQEQGSILVFLPGAGEIRSVEQTLQQASLGEHIIIAALYAMMDSAAQDRAIQAAPPGQRKIVIASAIAETSLTIEGIAVVIDAGLMRRQIFNANTGLSRLVTSPVSQAAADQRSGRAGRLQPGRCYRLWPAHQVLQAHSPAQIQESDLSALALELAQWGVRDAAQLAWLDPPPAAHLAQAQDLLKKLDAIDDDLRISEHGRAMLALGAHPRLAHMMLRANQIGYTALACDLAALLGERDPLRGENDADIILRLEYLRGSARYRAGGVALKTLRDNARRWRTQLKGEAAPSDHNDLTMAGVVLAYAYPDRIAQKRETGAQRYLLSNGRGAFLTQAQCLSAQDYLVALDLQDGREAQIYLGGGIRIEDLYKYHAQLIEQTHSVSWDEREQAVKARRQQRLGEIILSDEAWVDVDTQAQSAALLDGIKRAGIHCLPWSDQARQLQSRIHFMHKQAAQDWPDLSDENLAQTLAHWLSPYLNQLSRLSHLKKLDLHAVLLAQLSWQQQQILEQHAPTHIQVPSGSRIRLDYAQDIPVLAVRLQEMFGQNDTPRIGAGRIPVLVHLLSPARRPVQITQDLAAFWKGSYHDVKKELKGRYPKHHWPEDPLNAAPTAGAKRRRS